VHSPDYVFLLSYGRRSVVRTTAAPIDAQQLDKNEKGSAVIKTEDSFHGLLLLEPSTRRWSHENEKYFVTVSCWHWYRRSGQTRTPATLTTKPKNQRPQGGEHIICSLRIGRSVCYPGHSTTRRSAPLSPISCGCSSLFFFYRDQGSSRTDNKIVGLQESGVSEGGFSGSTKGSQGDQLRTCENCPARKEKTQNEQQLYDEYHVERD
jgi:hypothetical protein